MKTKISLLLVVGVLLCHATFGQPFGLSNRVANSTVQMPANPPAFGYTVTNAFGELAFTDPIAITTPPGETNRLFIVEQRGRIGVITNLASPNRTVFLDITNRVRAGGEEGMLGLAFHPNYASNRLFYVFYCVDSTSPGVATNLPHNRLSQFQTLAGDANLADTNSEVVLINQHDDASNHNGGDLHFGPDGYLYVSLGDEGGGNDNWNNSQRIDKDYFAGMLRIDVDKRPGNLAPNRHPSVITNLGGVANYAVPFDNPFVGATQFNGTNLNSANVRTEFWATGLRNPWRFSFDPPTGMLFCGDVGQGAREEIDIITKGGNYGWAFREGFTTGPRTAPLNFMHINPILDYGRGSGTNQGASVTGGVVYRGTKISQLHGAYIFADFVSGHIWSARYEGAGVTPFQFLTTRHQIAAFGVDPRNGDILMANHLNDRIHRLVYNTTVTGTPLPPTLANTGAFSDVATLTPNPGVVPYDLNVPFWSDNAKKTRWFSIPNTNLTITFNRTNNWQFPTGTVWIKHFDLELTNGVPASAKRLETRLLVKNSNGVYGVTYRWGNSTTNATLVPEEGMDEAFTINDGGNVRTQIWHYPSRSECLTCHTPAAGFALGFNTAQLNRDFNYSGITDHQIRALNHAGYFSSNVTNQHTLPAMAHATNSAVSAEYRVRSYLAANCAQCHQPGGTALGTWDARISNPLSASGIVNGSLVNNLGDTNNRVIVPNDLAHSMLLTRISMNGVGRMPPLGSLLTDTQAVNLVREWITNGLANYQTFAQWQLANFGSTNAPLTGANQDFDGDNSSNQQEYLLGTSPTNALDCWSISASSANGFVQIRFDQVANRGFEVQVATNLFPLLWTPLDAPDNRPFFSATNFPAIVPDTIEGESKYYRVRTFEP